MPGETARSCSHFPPVRYGVAGCCCRGGAEVCDESELACFLAPSRAHVGDAYGNGRGPHGAAWHRSGGLIASPGALLAAAAPVARPSRRAALGWRLAAVEHV